MSAVSAAEAIRIVHFKTVLESDFAKSVSINQQDFTWPIANCPGIISSETKNSGRKNLELVLLCNAIKDSGYSDSIKFIVSGNGLRRKKDVGTGKGDVLGHTVFADSILKDDRFNPSDFKLSDAVLMQGQFNVGVFTSSANVAGVHDAMLAGKLNSLVGVTEKSWKVDLKTMGLLGLKKVSTLPDHQRIGGFIVKKRADFTFAALGVESVTWGKTLYRVPDVKVALAGERVFIVNHEKPELHSILQKYINKLRTDEDQLTKAYIHAGFIDEGYKDWHQL